MNKLRVIETWDLPPTTNMAWDEELLQNGQGLVLRFYTWRPHGLSLGWFQNLPDDIQALCRQHDIHPVRRNTGGGAILHAAELTYSLSGPRDIWPFSGSVEASYETVHRAFRDPLRDFDRPVDFPASAPRTIPYRERPFFCFDRATRLDLCSGAIKIVGSAKRQSATRVLQHGSIVLFDPPFGPGVFRPAPCWSEVLKTVQALAQRLAETLALFLGMTPLITSPTTLEWDFVQKRMAETSPFRAERETRS